MRNSYIVSIENLCIIKTNNIAFPKWFTRFRRALKSFDIGPISIYHTKETIRKQMEKRDRKLEISVILFLPLYEARFFQCTIL